MTTKQQQSDEFEELYLKERKKSSVLLIATIVLALIASGSLIWAVSKGSNTQDLPNGVTNQGVNGQGGLRGNGPGMTLDIKSFFKDDGSVDTDKVDEITSRMPSGASSRFTDMIKEQVDQAVKDGDITQEQADALNKEIGITTESSNES